MRKRPAAITVVAPIAPANAAPSVPRARGDVHLGVKVRDGRSVIGDLRMAGSLKVLFPRQVTPDLPAVLVNTAGGVTGGDRMELAATVDAGAHLCLTTQAAERAYAAPTDQTGLVTTTVQVGEGARLHWLPQEMILFDGCRLQRRLDVDLAEGSRLLLAETLVFGRTARGEVVRSGLLDDSITVRRNGVPLVMDRIRMADDMAAHLARSGVAAGAGTVGTVIYVAPDAEAHLEPVRSHLGEAGGASLLAEDTLLIRLTAPDSFDARQIMVPLLTELSASALPKTWML